MAPFDAGSFPVPGRRWIEAWYDSAYALPVFLALFVACWTLFQIISFYPADLHPDIVEMYSWSQHPAPGYYKHPPLGALMIGAWFTLFPEQNWAAYLLAMCNSALALFFIDLIARRYLTREKRMMVLLLLLLTPFYQFHGVRFGANHTLFATWPLTVWCFLRAFESRSAAWGAAAGAAAALSMLGKYYSIFLVCGLALAAVVHPARLAYLRSPSPWASVAAGFAVLSPHLLWLYSTGFQPLGYAYGVHGVNSPLQAILMVPRYLASSAAFMVVPVAVYWLAVRPRLADVGAALWPRDPDRRMLAVLLWAPLLLPAVFGPVLGVELVGLWNMQAWFLLPVLLLMPATISLSREAAVRVAAGVAAVAVAALLASPVLAYVKHTQGPGEGRSYYAPLADEMTRRWRALTGKPLRIVLGDQDYVVAASFYSPDHPDPVPGFNFPTSPWVTQERLRREGFVVACLEESCLNKAARLVQDFPDVRRQQIEVVRRFFGSTTAPARFTLILVPPRE